MWELAGIAITSLNLGFADLPTTAHSYDGKPRDVSKFYKQTIPNIHLSGYTIIDDNDWIKGSITTGTYTEKMDEYPTINAEWFHNFKLENGWNIATSIGATLNFGTNHRSCKDDFSREYYCGNLTAWSDFKGNKDATIEPKIGITFTRHW